MCCSRGNGGGDTTSPDGVGSASEQPSHKDEAMDGGVPE